MTLSDIIELYDEEGSQYLYVDLHGFQVLEFSREEQELIMGGI